MTDRERLQHAIDEALAHISERESSGSGAGSATAELPERIVDRSDAIVRKKLGDTIYDLARRCATADPEVAGFTAFGEVEPADSEELRGVATLLASRTETPLGVEQLRVADSDDGVEQLEALDAAIDALEALEGQTDSSQFLRCMRGVAARDWEMVISLSVPLAESTTSVKWRTHARQETILALMRLERFEEATQVADAAERVGELTQMGLFNRAISHANAGNLSAFLSAAELFKSHTQRDAPPLFWQSLVERHIPDAVKRTGLSPAELHSAFGV